MTQLFRKLSLLAAISVLFSLASCIKKKDKVNLEDKLVTGGSDWKIVNHCSVGNYPSSRLEFNSDGTGKISMEADCEVGYDCQHYVHFYWDLDESDESVTITWRNGFQAMMVCSELQDQSTYIYPETENFSFDAETDRITVWNYNWEPR